MGAAEEAVGPKLRCRWCGVQSAPGLLCPECGAPRRTIGHIAFFFNYFAKNLAIPIVIVGASIFLTHKQQESASAAADREKLFIAYGDFLQAHSEYRFAESAITFIAVSAAQVVAAADLKGAVLKLDQALDSIGGKLTPFEQFEKHAAGYTSRYPDNKTALEITWQNCFIAPYYSGLADRKSYLGEITSILQLCDDKNCPIAAAQEIRRVLDKINSGRCEDNIPEANRKFTWFWGELKRIMDSS